MSFLRRLLGVSGDEANVATGTRRVDSSVNVFTRVRDDAVVHVVGEHYRQDDIGQARPPGPGDLPGGMPPPPPGLYKAMLIPEPTNQYDRNAIAVVLWAGDSWTQAGYLSRENALEYAPLFRHLGAGTVPDRIPAIACDAAMIDERGGTGVVLHLGTPGECAADLATEDRTPFAHQWVGQPIAFTGVSATTIYGVPVDRHAQHWLARWAGCDVLPRLTKKTAVLVVADAEEVTGNLQRARDYGVPTVSEPAFFAMIGLPSDAIGRVSGRWTRG